MTQQIASGLAAQSIINDKQRAALTGLSRLCAGADILFTTLPVNLQVSVIAAARDYTAITMALDWAGANLCGMHLNGIAVRDWHSVRAEHTTLDDAQIQGARGTTFAGASLERTSLEGEFLGCVLDGAQIDSLDARRATLRGVTCVGAQGAAVKLSDMDGVVWDESRLSNPQITGKAVGCYWNDAVLDGLTANEWAVYGGSFHNATFHQNTVFIRCQLTATRFSHTTWDSLHVVTTTFRMSDWGAACIKKGQVVASLIHNSVFLQAHITNVTFSAAIFDNCDFTQAQLIGCDFTRAEFIHTDLSVCATLEGSVFNATGFSASERSVIQRLGGVLQ